MAASSQPLTVTMPAWANWSRQSEAEHPHRRPLMLAQEVARMDPSEQIVLRGGMLPLKTQKACWFADRNFSTLVRSAGEIPRLDHGGGGRRQHRHSRQ